MKSTLLDPVVSDGFIINLQSAEHLSVTGSRAYSVKDCRSSSHQIVSILMQIVVANFLYKIEYRVTIPVVYQSISACGRSGQVSWYKLPGQLRIESRHTNGERLQERQRIPDMRESIGGVG